MSRFTPAPPSKPRQRLSIDGWKVSYYEPTFGMRAFDVYTHAALANAKAWLDVGGYVYRVSVLP
jgi:hypothetical protein